MNRRHWRDRLLVNAIVRSVRDSAKNENRNQNNQKINCQSDEAPEMVAASFEECAGMKPLAGIVGSQDSAGRKDHEDREEDRGREGSRNRSPEWRFGIRGERTESSKIESVHKLTGG